MMNEDDDYQDEYGDDYEEVQPKDVSPSVYEKINNAISFFEIIKFNFPEFEIPKRIYF